MAAQTVSIKMRTDDGIEKSEVIHFPDTYTLARIEDWLGSGGLEAYDDITGAQITDVTINLKYDFSGLGLAVLPVTGSRYGAGALMSFRADDGSAYSIFIPAVEQAELANLGPVAGGDVATFVDAAITGFNDGVNDNVLSDNDGSDLITFRGSSYRSRKL